MAFILPFPPDSRYREDDYINLAKGSGRASRSVPLENVLTPTDVDVADAACPTTASAPATPRRHVVLPDPVAFRSYLEDDPGVTVVERRRVLSGYELYLVEQWACSRQSPTLVIVTYTGDERHSVVVGVLAVPADESQWSTKLRVYFKATHQYHARPKDTELGQLMITNLSSFPSALTVIPVPDGDIRKHRQVFIVNEDLKRLGCLGRSGLTLSDPNKTAQAKFQQMYKVSERVPFAQAVTELIKLCQVALFLFEKLDQEYIDGLLCDVTETAIGNWWTEVGAEHYNYEPTDGILGPATVAALLGMLMGARNRLSWYGAPVAKDVFEIESTKRGIAYFQRSQKLEKTRRLDRQTLFRLHTVTAKAAAGEGWRMQKAVKSTMTEIGGKRGELVMGMVSGKEKAGLAEIETLDYDSFVALVYGERPKWLWHGKPRRTTMDTQESGPGLNGSLGREGQPNLLTKRAQSSSAEDYLDHKKRDDISSLHPSVPPNSSTTGLESPYEKDPLRKTVLKSVAGKMNDARTGFGRIKDAVGGGLRGHTPRLSITTKDDMTELGPSSSNPKNGQSPAMAGRAFTWKQTPEEYLNDMRRGDAGAASDHHLEGGDNSASSVHAELEKKADEGRQKALEIEAALETIGAEVRVNAVSRAPSAVRSTIDETDLRGPFLDAERKADPKRLVLARRHSIDAAEIALQHPPNEYRWPRHMSFGDAEQAILGWEEVMEITDDQDNLKEIEAFAELARHLNRSIDDIAYDIEPWVEEKLRTVEMLNAQYGRENDGLQNLYHQLSEACQRIRSSSEELLASERAQLTESVREVEVLTARLEYEINALVQKAADVDDGIRGFERQVEDAEKRADHLQAQLESESWIHWLVRTLTGVGTGPNIVKSTQ
ncbi:hypothetical protein S40288_06941 [Stachybotrys chartarum IBT 40288]|nr:hypothetical protein S40288_06941 [Stachybotrys chartarum IBT 40288]